MLYRIDLIWSHLSTDRSPRRILACSDVFEQIEVWDFSSFTLRVLLGLQPNNPHFIYLAADDVSVEKFGTFSPKVSLNLCCS